MNKQKLISGLLFGASLALSAASSIMAAYRQPKYEQVLCGLKEGKFKKPVAIAKTHWPSMVLWGASASCAIAGKVIDVKAIAGLASTAGYLALTRDKWKARFRDFAGEEEYERAEEEIIREVVCTAGPSVEETDRGDQLCFEAYSGRWFRSDKLAVDKAVAEFKKRFEDGDYLCFNDLYQLLGIAETHFGFQVGYANSPDYYDDVPDIQAFMVEPNDRGMKQVFGKLINESVYVIETFTYPMECWMEV
jgi:hypothetical protein